MTDKIEELAKDTADIYNAKQMSDRLAEGLFSVVLEHYRSFGDKDPIPTVDMSIQIVANSLGSTLFAFCETVRRSLDPGENHDTGILAGYTSLHAGLEHVIEQMKAAGISVNTGRKYTASKDNEINRVSP